MISFVSGNLIFATQGRKDHLPGGLTLVNPNPPYNSSGKPSPRPFHAPLLHTHPTSFPPFTHSSHTPTPQSSSTTFSADNSIHPTISLYTAPRASCTLPTPTMDSFKISDRSRDYLFKSTDGILGPVSREPRSKGACTLSTTDGKNKTKNMSGLVSIVTDQLVRPNGIVFSPDQKTAYIADTGLIGPTIDVSRPATM